MAVLRQWRNWQTHQLEGLAVAIPWRFESSLPHHFHVLKNLSGNLPRAGSVFVLVTNVGQPFLQDGLILLFDLAEHHAHAIVAHIHDVAERGENCAAVKDAQSYPGACRE